MFRLFFCDLLFVIFSFICNTLKGYILIYVVIYYLGRLKIFYLDQIWTLQNKEKDKEDSLFLSLYIRILHKTFDL
ncbi:hypothetical protein L2E82_14314 [Cichorium intybus]|uniref:Uncharacterized protein n=1 Tax=Cichorium intybus TaxID=13427 RepID=A0ACB9F0X0_CICIN|nr:hypothetical protein L2E82_14314 [Cichorium intybus]